MWDPETAPRWEPAPTGPEGQPGAAGQALDDAPIREVHRATVAGLWLGATDRAISALGTWRAILAALGAGDPDAGPAGRCGPTDPAALRPALAALDVAGLGEWAEWGAGLDLDELNAALFPGK